MTELGVGKAITTHIQLKVMVIIFRLFAVVKISRVKFTRDSDSIGKLVSSLLRMCDKEVFWG